MSSALKTSKLQGWVGWGGGGQWGWRVGGWVGGGGGVQWEVVRQLCQLCQPCARWLGRRLVGTGAAAPAVPARPPPSQRMRSAHAPPPPSPAGPPCSAHPPLGARQDERVAHQLLERRGPGHCVEAVGGAQLLVLRVAQHRGRQAVEGGERNQLAGLALHHVRVHHAPARQQPAGVRGGRQGAGRCGRQLAAGGRVCGWQLAQPEAGAQCRGRAARSGSWREPPARPQRSHRPAAPSPSSSRQPQRAAAAARRHFPPTSAPPRPRPCAAPACSAPGGPPAAR
jgi:hypothetical protein